MGLEEFEDAYSNIQNLNVGYNPAGNTSAKKAQSLPLTKIQAAPEKSKLMVTSKPGPSKLDTKNTENFQRQNFYEPVKDLPVFPVSIKLPFFLD